MIKQRPVNLDLTKFHFPVMAIISILHRIFGVVLFLFIPLLLTLLDLSFARQESGYHLAMALLHNNWMRFFIWVLLCSVSYHFVAGIRHLLMDFGFFESLKAGRASAYTVLTLALALFVLAGVWVW